MGGEAGGSGGALALEAISVALDQARQGWPFLHVEVRQVQVFLSFSSGSGRLSRQEGSESQTVPRRSEGALSCWDVRAGGRCSRSAAGRPGLAMAHEDQGKVIVLAYFPPGQPTRTPS